MVEAIANGIEDKLINGLSFKLAPGASYVTDRRSVTYHPQGSNVYQPGAGTKLIRIMLTGDNWLDPSTFRVMFNVNNTETAAGKNLRVLGGPWCFFRRMRILVAGQLVEDIDQYNRVHEMTQTLVALESRHNDAAEAFGAHWDNSDWDYNGSGHLTSLTLGGIKPGQNQTVLFKPLSGLLNQNKMIPIRYAPITIELELVDDAKEPVIDPGSYGADGWTDGNTSTAWQINNVQVKVDVCTLDNALDNSYAQHLLSGKTLPIAYNTFISQIQTVAGQDAPSINVSRALTRLKSVFVTLVKDYGNQRATLFYRKYWNDFFSPMYDDNDGEFFVHNSLGEFEFQIQIGSKLFPEYPIRSHSEAYYQLKKCLGVQSSSVHNFNISGKEYRSHKLILGTDCEKVLDAGYTGLNTRAGDLMTVKLKYNDKGNLENGSYTRLADRMHIVLHSDQILEIRDSGAQVFD
jgi:hypothetical protein